MAFVLACLKCGAKLRSATRLRAGRRHTCPTCRAAFTLHADAEPEGRRGRADPIPDAVLIDDDEEDDRPPVGRRRREDEDDDRPPVSRRRRREDDDEVRPRGRRQRPVSPPVLLGVAIGLFFIFLAVGLAGWFLFGKTPPAAATDLIAFAPADSVALAGYDLDALTAHDGLKAVIDKRPPGELAELDRTGLRPADLSRALVARTNNGVAAAVRFRAPPDKARYLAANVVGKSYAPVISLGSFRFGYFADNKTLVLADTEPAVQGVLDGKGQPQVSNRLRGLAERARGPMWQATGRVDPFKGPRFGPIDERWLLRFGATSGSVAWLEPGTALTDVRYEIEFDSAHQAGFGAGVLRTQFAMRRGMIEAGGVFGQIPAEDIGDVRRGYETATVTEDGHTVSARLRLPPAEAVRAVEALRP
jgi:hypothetical protein